MLKLTYAVMFFILFPVSFVFPQGFDFGRLKIKTSAGSQAETTSKPSYPSIGTSGTVTKSGIKLSLPPAWKIVRDDPNSLDAQGPNGMWLAIVTNDYGSGFPVDASLKAYADSAKQEKQQGKLISWEERVIDGVRGIQRVESPMLDPDDPRRITWIGYKGTIGINIVASCRSKDFENNYSALSEVVGGLKW